MLGDARLGGFGPGLGGGVFEALGLLGELGYRVADGVGVEQNKLVA
jgi:hypothetical protein